MNSRWMILLAALPLVAMAAEENAQDNSETRTRGDVLIVEESEGERTRAPKRETDKPIPHRGLAMDNVRNVFGEPQAEHPAVGDPPITRWDYDGYSVFFEFDKVIHTVVTE